MAQKLILITSGFPYGKGETFLETEIIFLCEAFAEVVVITTNTSDTQIRTVPENCKVLQLDITPTSALKLKSFRSFLSPLYIEEVKWIKKIYQRRLSSGMIKTLLISLERAKRVADFIRQQQFDIENTVFYSYWCDDTALGLAILKQKNSTIKCISRIHRWDIYFEESSVNYLPFRAFIAHQMNKIFSISQDGIEYAASNWKVNINNFILSRLGVKKSDRVSPEGQTFKIVSCSNVIAVKRVQLIAEALMEMKEMEIVWTHFGDGILFNKLKEIVSKLPKNIQVKLPGRVLNHEIYQAYQDIQPHAFINVSTSEGVPVSIMEAMSFGIPCIATDVGGNNEIVNNENGVLLSANPSLDSILMAFRAVLNDEGKRNAAYQTWEEKFNAQKNYTEFVEFLVNLK